MQKYRADIAYIGTAYSGFQSQANGDSIQDRLEHTFSMLLRHPLRVRGASRTDAGVHAEQQVVSFQSDKTFHAEAWKYSANSLLPPDICVRSIGPVLDTFDPINDAKAKVYRYRLWRGHCYVPFFKGYVWSVPPSTDFSRLPVLIKEFVGKHDFSSFCNKDSDAASKVRTIFDVRVDLRDPLVDIWILGSGFLKQMVRIMIGTLVDIVIGNLKENKVQHILDFKKRESAGQTAPPQGLNLVRIYYEEQHSLDSVIEESARGFSWRV